MVVVVKEKKTSAYSPGKYPICINRNENDNGSLNLFCRGSIYSVMVCRYLAVYFEYSENKECSVSNLVDGER